MEKRTRELLTILILIVVIVLGIIYSINDYTNTERYSILEIFESGVYTNE